MKKFATVFLFFISSWAGIYAQSNPYPEVTISSPTAAALGKYGDIPVNYFTGVPDISVSIYTIKEGPLTLPISLSYHAGGVKLMELASWVGLGWSLNAGGVITRTVQGAPDEYGTSNTSSQTFGHFSQYGFNNYLYLNQNGQTAQGNIQDWANFANGNKDGQPDLFFFNFNGYAGKFYFSDDRTPVIVPQQDFKIDYTYSSGASIQSFVITTPDGTKYIFGNTSNVSGAIPVESTNPWSAQSGSPSGTVISSWFLNRIQSPDGIFNIDLQYLQENYGYFTIGTHPVNPNFIQNNDQTGCYLVKNIVNGVRLAKISFANGEVDFLATNVRQDLSDKFLSTAENTNTTAKSLDQIQILDNAGFCKAYNFSYGYFNDANSTNIPSLFNGLFSNLHTDLKRLRLDGIQAVSCTGTSNEQPYQFSYSTENLPRRLCFAQDYWGFNNGQTTNTSTLIPTYTTTVNGVPTDHPGADRKPLWPAMSAGTLTKITYPTGGSDKLDFEANGFTEQQSNGAYDTKTLKAHVFGQGNYTDMATLTITDATHPVIITVNMSGTTNGSAFSTSFTIKNHNTGIAVQDYNPYYIPDGTVGDLFPYPVLDLNTPYDFILTVPEGVDGGCLATINYNWATTTSLQNTTVAGLRIKKITKNDNIDNTNDIVTNYSYSDNTGYSTGVLYDIPAFVQVIRNDIIKNVGYWTINGFQQNTLNPNGCATAPSPQYYISAGNLRPMSALQGFQMGYKQVQVSQTGNGKTVYHYNIGGNLGYSQQYPTHLAITEADLSFCDPAVPNFPAYPQPFDSKRGEKDYDEYFSESGSILKDIHYTPVFNTSVAPVTPVFIVSALSTSANTTQYFGTFDSMRNVRKESLTTVETDYSPAGNLVIQKTKYFGSNNHNEITREVSNDSKGNSIENIYKYAFDFRIAGCDNSNCFSTYSSACIGCQNTYNSDRQACANNDAQCLTDAYLAYQKCQNTSRINYITCQKAFFTSYVSCYNSTKNSADANLKPILEMQYRYINVPIETTSWRSANLTGAQFNKFAIAGDGNVYINRVQKVDVSSLSPTFTNAAVNGSGLTKDTRYLDEASVNYRLGNIHDVTNKTGLTNTYIWDYGNDFPVAKISGASSTDTVAYTSFESNTTGGWTVASSQRYKNSSTTGNQSYNLSSGNITKSINPSVKYKITFWSKSQPTVSGATKTFTGKKNFELFTYYEYVSNNNASLITISGSSLLIDELRLYPVYAQMNTYTYSPLIGMTSQCDENNAVTYYEYDDLGRLAHVRDQDNYILKKYCYNYAGQSAPCTLTFKNGLQSKTFVKKDCTNPGYGGSEVVDSVLAGLYSSGKSQEDADAQAIAYLNTNGQAFANTKGTCLVRQNVILDNYEHVTGFTITFTNVYDSTLIYTLSLPQNADSTLGQQTIPQGHYNIDISATGNTNSYVFTVSGPAGQIQVNSSKGSWVNVPVNTNAFNRISVGIKL